MSRILKKMQKREAGVILRVVRITCSGSGRRGHISVEIAALAPKLHCAARGTLLVQLQLDPNRLGILKEPPFEGVILKLVPAQRFAKSIAGTHRKAPFIPCGRDHTVLPFPLRLCRGGCTVT